MVIDDLLLKEDEIPIYHEVSFYVPIHPSLLTKKLNPELPNKVFEQSVKEWHEELKLQVDKDPSCESSIRIAEVYLNAKPKLHFKAGEFTIYPWRISGIFTLSENGFANMLSVGRNFGSLIFSPEDFDCKHHMFKNSKYMQFSKEKIKAYTIPGNENEQCFTYAHHNIDTFPSALLLRNWALHYVNAALKS